MLRREAKYIRKIYIKVRGKRTERKKEGGGSAINIGHLVNVTQKVRKWLISFLHSLSFFAIPSFQDNIQHFASCDNVQLANTAFGQLESSQK